MSTENTTTTTATTKPKQSAPKQEAPKPTKDDKPVVNIAAQKDGQRIDGIIKQVMASYSKSRMLVQNCAIDIMRHAAPVTAGGKGYGDCTRAYKLAMAVPVRERNALVRYFEEFSPIGIDFNRQNARFRNEEAKDIVARGYVWNIDGTGQGDDHVDGAVTQYWFDEVRQDPAPRAYSSIGDFWGVVTGMLDKAIKDADKQSLANDRGMVYNPQARDRIKKSATALKKIVLDFKAAETKASTEGKDVEAKLELEHVEPKQDNELPPQKANAAA